MSKFSSKGTCIAPVSFRDLSPNKYFQALQITDIASVTDENTVFVWDFDGVPFKEASKVEDDYIKVKLKSSGETWELKNKTEFKGATKVVSANSWLGIKNLERESKKLEPWTLEDFDVSKHKRMKFEKCYQDVVDSMENYIDMVRNQWEVKNFLFVLGKGDCFRNDLPLPVPYKDRNDERPMLLKEAREYMLAKDNSEEAKEGFETDDVVEWYGATGYADYLKTKIFSYVVISEDKDSGGNPKLWINYRREGITFVQPQAVLIETSSVNTGHLELVRMSNSTQVKGTGLKWIMAQAFGIGDSADNYHPYNKFPADIKKNIKYGQKQFYLDFINLETQTEVVQKAVDLMYEWFPKGIKYTDHKGNDLDVDTLTWMDTCFKVAFMTRSPKENLTLERMLKAFRVDYAKIVGNNVEKVIPFKEDKELREVIKQLSNKLEVLIDSPYKKTDKKDLLLDHISNNKTSLVDLKDSLETIFFKEE